MKIIVNFRKTKENLLCRFKLQKNHVKVGENAIVSAGSVVTKSIGGANMGWKPCEVYKIC